MFEALALTVLTAVAPVAATTEAGQPVAERTVICTVIEGMTGIGVPDAAPLVTCRTMACVISEGIPGVDGAADAARLVYCRPYTQ